MLRKLSACIVTHSCGCLALTRWIQRKSGASRFTAEARRLLDASRPKLTKEEYLAFNRDLNGRERFSAADLAEAAE